MNKTLHYYNTQAQDFYERTINIDLSQTYQAFLKYLPKTGHILDAGCGVGRDAKYFLKQGYEVTAFDASKAMVEIASKETELQVRELTFQEMNFDHEFEGVWAQASLLHISYEETPLVYKKIHQALKPNGIFYGSYKYGRDPMPTLDRDFWNMDEEKIMLYLKKGFEVLEVWKEKDTRSQVAPSSDAMWLNFIVRKKDEALESL